MDSRGPVSQSRSPPAEAHLFLGVAREETGAPVEDVEGVLHVGVRVPGHLLSRRDLQLSGPELRPLGVVRPPLDLEEMARVLHRFHRQLRPFTSSGLRDHSHANVVRETPSKRP